MSVRINAKELSMTYYVILVNGVPIEVTQHWSRAVKAQAELSSTSREATIVPVEPREDVLKELVELTKEFGGYDEFKDEEETNPQLTLPFELTETYGPKV